jgi:tetratricopeptide (TPR) repeat protein
MICCSICVLKFVNSKENLAQDLLEIDQLLRADAVERAVERLQTLSAAHPENPRVIRRMAFADIKQGNTDHALQQLADLVERNPDDAISAFEYGRSLGRLGELSEAIKVLRRLVGRVPSLAPAWYSLGDVLCERGDFAESRRAYQQAALNDPFRDKIDEAKQAMQAGQSDRPEKLFAEVLARDPGHVEALTGREAIAMARGEWIEAERLCTQIRERTHYWPTFLLGQSQLFLMTSRFEDARQSLGTLVQLEPTNVLALNMLGTACEMLMLPDESVAAFRQSLEILPDQPRALISIANVQRSVGDRAESEATLRRAIAMDPGNGEAYWALSNLKNYKFSSDEVSTMEENLRRDSNSLHSAAPMHFALGLAYEQQGLFDRAFTQFDAGNSIQKRHSQFSGTLYEQEIERLCKTFDSDLLSFGLDRDWTEQGTPIFVVGLPRTGSTLVEQILASHSKVDATMELPFIGQFVRELAAREKSIGPYPESARHLAEADLTAFAQRYFDLARIYRGDAAYFVDKTPENFIHLGLIAMMMPNAIFIDVRRHPIDTCLSAFRQRFAVGGEFTYDIKDLGGYFRGYRKLMAHWDRVMPDRIYPVIYESLVGDPDVEIPRLLDFCKLPLEDSCVQPHLTRRQVRTPSSEQVREPISASRIGFWKNYEDHLLELPGMLQPEIAEFESALNCAAGGS